MRREEIIADIEARRREIRGRIEAPPEKDRLGTITGDEGNELDIMKDHKDFTVFDEVIELIRRGHFATLQELYAFL
jgi:hypothetical protein